MSSSNQRRANRGFRSVLRCAISHYRPVPSLSAPEPPPGVGSVYSIGVGSFLRCRIEQGTTRLLRLFKRMRGVGGEGPSVSRFSRFFKRTLLWATGVHYT